VHPPGGNVVTLTEVYLARHGQTVWNVERRRQGHLDSPLTNLGLEQARCIGVLAASLPADAIFASPLGRASTTAEIIGTTMHLAVTPIAGLAEVHHGRVGGLIKADISIAFPNLTALRTKNKYTYRFPGGESYADADARAGSALELISGTGVRRPLIVSHEMIGRMLLKNLLQMETNEALAFKHPHDVIYRVNLTERIVERIHPDGTEHVWPKGASL
jgi:broad specificity phosphatase PhoE